MGVENQIHRVAGRKWLAQAWSDNSCSAGLRASPRFGSDENACLNELARSDVRENRTAFQLGLQLTEPGQTQNLNWRSAKRRCRLRSAHAAARSAAPQPQVLQLGPAQAAWFQGIFAKSIPIMQLSVIPAKVKPAPTAPDKANSPG